MIFEKMQLTEPSLFGRLFGKQPKENAIIEINNLLAEKHLKDITVEDVLKILEKYKVGLYTKHHNGVSSLYASYLRNCLLDKKITDDEINELKHLKRILHLNDLTIEEIHNQLASEIYKAEFEKAISEGRLNDSEKDFLMKLRNDLRLSDDIVTKIRNVSTKQLIQNFLDNAISDQRLSPDEEKELNAIAHSLDVDLKVGDNTQATLDKYKLFWQIENSEIPSLPVSINLQKNEKCYFQTQVDWLEQRRITKRINYGGPTLSIKIAKGLYWRTGSLGVQRVSEDVWTKIDSGTLYLTSKKIIFMGSKGNKSIQLNKILDFTAYKNGVDIQKETGKSPFLQFDRNIDIFAMTLGRAIGEY